MDAVIFLVLLAIALVFRWLTQQAENRPEAPRPRQPEERKSAAPEESDQERIRRFLEALGVPSDTAPPPKVQPRPPARRRVVAPKPPPVPRAKRSWVQPLPPLVTTPENIPTVSSEGPVVVAIAPPVLGVSAEAPTVTQPQAPPARQVVSFRRSNRPLVTLLRSPAGVRQAIMLREIVGPPRAFAPGSFFDPL